MQKINNKNIFIDANIFIDLNDKRRVTSEECLYILNFLVQNGYSIMTSCDLITTIYYILSKINKQKALDDIEQINKICKIIEFSNSEVTSTCTLMKEDENYKDFEDTIQYVLAKKANCNIILSNDKKFYSKDITLFSSSEFIQNIIKK